MTLDEFRRIARKVADDYDDGPESLYEDRLDRLFWEVARGTDKAESALVLTGRESHLWDLLAAEMAQAREQGLMIAQDIPDEDEGDES